MADIETRNPRRKPWPAIVLVVVVTAIAIWLVPSDEPQVVELPPASAPTADAPVPDTSAPAPLPEDSTASGQVTAGKSARELIAAQRSNGKPDPKAAYARARQLQKAGQVEDAYLLDFYAARLGHAQSAFALAERADPAHWKAGDALKTPAPAQALKWYRVAQDAGHPDARKRVAALRKWAETAAAKGDAEAQRLMLAWQ